MSKKSVSEMSGENAVMQATFEADRDGPGPALHHRSLIPGNFFLHYKNGKEYMFLTLAINPNTDEQIAVYRERNYGAPSGPYYWRPVAEFREKFRKKI
jgi:hypothetical protein